MNSSKDATIFIDLSFLSPDEEAVIRQVLLRDDQLKRQEIGRVRKLRESISDRKELKILSGEWFEDLRSRRYGRQPESSAVVRSSMRWKKSAGHKPNPFLNAVLEEKDGEENKTRPKPSADPRSIHPALNAEVGQEYKDEDFFLEVEAPSGQSLAKNILLKEQNIVEVTNPIHNATNPGTQSTGKPKVKDVSQDKSPFTPSNKPEPVLELKTKGAFTTNVTPKTTNSELERKVSLPPALKKDRSLDENWVRISVENNSAESIGSKLTGGKVPEDTLEVTSFSVTPEASGQDLSQRVNLSKIQDSSKNVPKVDSGKIIFSSQRTEIEVKQLPGKKNELVMIKDGSSREELAISQSLPSEPKKVDELIGSGQDLSQQVNSSKIQDSSKNVSKVEAGKIIFSSQRAEVEVKQLPGQRRNELVVIKEGSASEELALSRSLPSEPKKVDELLADSLRGRENTTKIPTVSSTEMIKIQQTSSNAAPQPEKKTAKEIESTDIKKSPPTGVDVLSVDIKVDGSTDVPLYEKSGSAQDTTRPKDSDFDQKNMFVKMKGGKLEEIVMENAGGPEGKEGFDVEIVDSESPDKIALPVSVQMDQRGAAGKIGDTEPRLKTVDASEISTEELKKESDILTSVYARALTLKLPLAKSPKQEKIDVIPSIVIESEGQETEGVNNGTASSKPQVEVTMPVTAFTADTWEDEGVDSDGDSSSVSSYGSDLSGRRGVSTSTLSVTGRTGSLLSVYSDAGDFGNVTVQGSVEFALMYSPLGEIVIMVEQCQDLAIANPRKQRTDPYVKTYLYPDKRSKRKTSIKKRTVNPVFVESLRYKVKREELHEKTLNLSVWHNDSRGRNVFLGQVEINLKSWDWRHQALTWYNLQPKGTDNQDSQEDYGQLSFSLKYVAPETTGGSKVTAGEIHVWLREAKNLRRLKTQGVDSFVKCYMLPDTSRKSRQKTRVVKKSQNPVYNHSMVYEGFRPGEVREACCELTVWDNNKLSNQFLGGVRVSLGTGQSYGKKVDWMDSASEETEIWEKMLANPNTWVEADLPLRSSMTPRK